MSNFKKLIFLFHLVVFYILIFSCKGYKITAIKSLNINAENNIDQYEFNELELKQLEVPLGSVLIFDGKINHRGKGNNSNDERPCIYQVYHKKWYNDQFRIGVCED